MSEVNTTASENTTPAAEVKTVTESTLVTAPIVADAAAKTETVVPPVVETETKKEEVKTETTPPPAKVVPEKYDLKLPEGSPLDQSVLSRIEEFAKANKLSNEEAQTELNRESASAASYVQTLHQKIKENNQKWVAECKADPEVGGAKFQKSLSDAQRAINKYAPAEFIRELEVTGYGNHPALVKTFARIGVLMADDQAVNPGASATELAGNAALDIMYDNTPKK